MVTVYQWTADLQKPITQTRLTGLFAQEDALAHRFEISILDGGQPAALTGNEGVTAYFTRHADQTTVLLLGKITADRRAAVTLSDACYAREGAFSLIIKVSSGNVRHAVFYATGYVTRDRTGVVIDENDVIPSIDELLAQIASMEAAVDAANEAAQDARQETQQVASIRGQAQTALENAQSATAAASGWARATASINALAPTDNPTVSVSTQEDGAKHIAFSVPRGQTGVTPALSIGTVTTGDPGTQASASITGTPEAPTLNMTIPRGATGSIENLPFSGQEPAALGEASPGTAETVAKSDHVHPMPTAADVGALALSATAADSERLGGKAPEYYVQPYNLLDNSDFTNPVNQRGADSYGASWAYAIDRWIVAPANPGSTIGLAITAGGVTVTSSSGDVYLIQRVPIGQIADGAPYTLAYKKADGAVAVQILSSFESVGGTSRQIVFTVPAGTTVVWAALYKGEYTADTLTTYVPN